MRVKNRDHGQQAAIKYEMKPSPYSSHSLVLDLFPEQGNGRRVLDIGCAEGFLARILAGRGYEVVGIDKPGQAPRDFPENSRFVHADLDRGMPSLPEAFDFILCADILEHLRDPLQLLLDLHPRLTAGGRLVASLPNSGNLYFRLCVMMGHFSAHDRGLFDRTHLHFYTWKGWRDLFARGGFRIEKVLPTGVPVGLALPRWKDSLLIRLLERIAYDVARLWETLFAYQFVVVARPEVPS